MTSSLPLTLAISPCPNDTFIFESWVTGKLNAEYEVTPTTTFLDIQNLNEAAQSGTFDVVKVSCGNLHLLRDQYTVLRSGGAMGFGCGPLLLSNGRKEFDPNVETLLPGRNTTAALLFRHAYPHGAKVRYVLFNEVYRSLIGGNSEQGVVIHEHRFTYARDGLTCLQDLGAYWEATMHSPIPLGVIVARNSLGVDRITQIENTIRASLDLAWARPQLITPFIQGHAQETDAKVMEEHIRMFVNDFSREMGEQGEAAIQRLESLANSHHLL